MNAPSGLARNPSGGVARPPASGSYPWYDSVWLQQFRRALEIIANARPGALEEFRSAMGVFETTPDFRTKVARRPFDEKILDELRGVVADLKPADLELHEARTFRRFVVHDHPLFKSLQQVAVPLVSSLAGEEVEPSYSFLAMYSAGGVCPLHLDAPFAKWTLDICIDQAVDWPIHVSGVHPWDGLLDPERYSVGWQDRVKSSPDARFEAFRVEPGDALLFSGTSQWHYRDPMPATAARRGATLLFLHFIPRGTADLVRPETWAGRFAIPELAQVGTADGGLPA